MLLSYRHTEYLSTVQDQGKQREKAEDENKRERKEARQRENPKETERERENFSAGHQYSSITSCLSQLVMSPRSQETGAW